MPVKSVTQAEPSLKASSGPVVEVAANKAVKYVRTSKTLKVTFTSRGGAVEQVELLREFADTEKKSNVIFNADGAEAALALAVQNPVTKQIDVVHTEFKPEGAESADAITLVGNLADGTRVVRAFTLVREGAEATEPYSLRFSTQLFPSKPGVGVPKVWLTSGSWQPTKGDSANQFLSVLASDGEDLTRTGIDVFTDSNGFFGLGARKAKSEQSVVAPKPFAWVASGNQFFASIIHPDATLRGVRSEVLVKPVEFATNKRGLQAMASWESPVRPDFSTVIEGDFFVGPKEYARVSNLPDGQVAVLQFSKLFGFISFGAICKLLLACLGGVHYLLSWAGSWAWGWAIVALTLFIKLITWPLTSAQQKAAKKMQKFAQPMKDIREKYKDNPEKMNKELMKLYSEHQINPFAGCLPILIQMPIFFGLYTAFQTTVELRLHSFLWISDLSAPDTLFQLGGFPINLLPILMGLSMWQSMRMTPNPSADDSQKMIFMMMTLMFPVICYGSPAALTLYMTLQNLLTMLQTWLTKEPSVEVIPPSPKTKVRN
jgi:YidC/Oxa1 family membrane protein insertase